jgi:hypothetical protein
MGATAPGSLVPAVSVYGSPSPFPASPQAAPCACHPRCPVASLLAESSPWSSASPVSGCGREEEPFPLSDWRGGFPAGRGPKNGASSSSGSGSGRGEGPPARAGRSSEATPLKKTPLWKQQSQQLQAAIQASRQ